MSRYRRLKIEGEAFFCTLVLALANASGLFDSFPSLVA
jgi:hypothetical protein